QRPPPPPPKRGADIQYRLAVPFMDAAAGRDQRITLADGKAINLKLPAGVTDGTQMRLRGKGHSGPGGNGDGIVLIEVSGHPFFHRDGDNIRMDLPITLNEAIRGAKVKCPTVDGPVMLTIKPGTNGGTVMRLGGKGWTKAGGKAGERGDQLVTLEIQLPEDLAKLEEQLGDWVDPARPREKFGL
ncbi:MAG: J domain-containing protein, partial [Pseudomonadota bacterium]